MELLQLTCSKALALHKLAGFFLFFFAEIAKYILQQIKCDSRGILYEHAVDVAYETSFVRIL